MELHLIRHPAPDVAAGICYGCSDVGLAAPVNEDATRLRALLPSRFELHASPLARARVLAEALGIPRIDTRLREMHFGEWEMTPYATIGNALDGWIADPLGFRAPGGESANELNERVLDWLQDLLAREPASPVVVVAHGGPLRVIAGHLLGMPPERWLALDFACGRAARIDVEAWGAVLKWFNR